MKKGFSLVELLISLIVISVITASFAPVITKRLKGNLLVLNSSTNSNGAGGDVVPDSGSTPGGDDDHEYLDPACENGPNKTCCDNLNAIYISSTTHPGYGGKPICMTKYNVGDELFGTENNYYNPVYAKLGVQMIYPYVANIHDAVCVMTDMNKNTCCWKGTTSTTTATSGNNISSKGYPVSYGGLERTVCQWEAANTLCENWARGGSYKGSWRLPTDSEMLALASYISLDTATETDSHVNLSKWAGNNGLQLCDLNANVTNSKQKAYRSADRCPTAGTCRGARSNQCIPSSIWSNTKPYSLNNGALKATTFYNNITAGVRCVTEHPGQRIKDPEVHTPQGTEPTSQEDCDQYGALFIDAKFTGGSKNLCVLQYSTEPISAGGKYEFDYIASGVSLLSSGQTCKLTDGTCCWYNGTGTTGGAWDYPGSGRAVCQWQAANSLCANYKPTEGVEKTGKWRLPTNTELNALSMYLMASSEYSPFISKYLDNGSTGGIQLCDSSSYLFGSNTCKTLAKCGGAPESKCQPWAIWSSTTNGSSAYWGFSLTKGVFKQVSYNYKVPLSVRCVTDSLEGEVQKPYEPDDYEPRNQSDCDDFGAIFIEQKYTGTKNLCMTKFNTGDSDLEDIIPFDFVSSRVQLMKVSQKCVESGMCCWQGKTSTGTIAPGNYGGSYSPNNRTMCQRDAASSLCSKWKPNPNGGSESHYGNWRLPTDTELSNMINAMSSGGQDSPGLTKYASDDGLMLCDGSYNTYGAHRCPNSNVCTGAKSYTTSSDDPKTYTCFPNRLWSNDYLYILGTGKFSRETTLTASNYKNYAASTRCVSSDVRKKIADAEYQPKSSDEPQSQSDCGNSAMFIPQKYTGTTNLCMAKTNFADLNPIYSRFKIGDNSAEAYSNIGVTVVPSNTTCPNSANAKCCWQGSTATAGGVYSYSSNARTVCQYEAAKTLCEAIGWRLLTQNEMIMLSYAMNATSETGNITLSRYQDDSLQLCDYSATTYGSNKCVPLTQCKGATNNYCYPSDVWNQAGSYRLNNGIFSATSYLISTASNKKYTASVRCVTDKKLY